MPLNSLFLILFGLILTSIPMPKHRIIHRQKIILIRTPTERQPMIRRWQLNVIVRCQYDYKIYHLVLLNKNKTVISFNLYYYENYYKNVYDISNSLAVFKIDINKYILLNLYNCLTLSEKNIITYFRYIECIF